MIVLILTRQKKSWVDRTVATEKPIELVPWKAP
jgi:hypothetical protein